MPRKNKGIQVKYRKDRECWELIEYIGGKRKRHATGFSCREHAEEKLAEIIVQRQKPQKGEHLSIGKVIAYYINEHVPTLANPRTAILCFERLIPYWSEIKVKDIRKSLCLNYLEHRRTEFNAWQEEGGYSKRRTLSDETVRRELEQLQAAIRYAHKDNILDTYPAIWKPRKSKSRSRWLTKKEAAKLLRATDQLRSASHYMKLFILIGLYTGARSDAILSLRWENIDLDRGFIDFRNAQKSANKQAAIVPVPKRLMRELGAVKNDVGYVITLDGKKIGSVKTSFRRCCAIAGLDDVTPHTLRHTAASWMVQKGVPLFEVAKYLGHSTSMMIEKTYGHLAPDHLRRASESYG